VPARAEEEEKIWRHGLSLFGDLKYPQTSRASIQSGRAQGWKPAQLGFGTYDNFNIESPGQGYDQATGSR